MTDFIFPSSIIEEFLSLTVLDWELYQKEFEITYNGIVFRGKLNKFIREVLSDNDKREIFYGMKLDVENDEFVYHYDCMRHFGTLLIELILKNPNNSVYFIKKSYR